MQGVLSPTSPATLRTKGDSAGMCWESLLTTIHSTPRSSANGSSQGVYRLSETRRERGARGEVVGGGVVGGGLVGGVVGGGLVGGIVGGGVVGCAGLKDRR